VHTLHASLDARCTDAAPALHPGCTPLHGKRCTPLCPPCRALLSITNKMTGNDDWRLEDLEHSRTVGLAARRGSGAIGQLRWTARRSRFCGEPLHSIWWRGRQWAVTEYGIEALDGTYSFEAKRLTEDIATWGRPAHMAEKDWVDIEDFSTAWLVALALHRRVGRAIRKALARMPIAEPASAAVVHK
jgi:hypothetical protein